MQNRILTMRFVQFGYLQLEDHMASCVSVYALFFKHSVNPKVFLVAVNLKMLSLALSDPLIVAIFD